MEPVILRFGNCYGPLSSHKSSVVAKFIRDALVGIPWEISAMEPKREILFSSRMLPRRLSWERRPRRWAGECLKLRAAQTTVLELATKIACVLRNCDVTPPTVRRVKARLGDVKRSYFNTSKAQTRIAWRPKVPLEEGTKSDGEVVSENR